MFSRPTRFGLKHLVTIAFVSALASASAQSPRTPSTFTQTLPSAQYGPYNGVFLQGGMGLSKPLHDHDPLAVAQASWSLSLWFKTADSSSTTLLAGVGHPWDSSPRYLALRNGHPIAWSGGTAAGAELTATTALAPDTWHALALSVDPNGTSHLFADGIEVASGHLPLGPTSAALDLAPTAGVPMQGFRHFSGWLASVTLHAAPIAASEAEAQTTPLRGLDNLPFEEGSKPWPVQTRASLGLSAQQDPATLPHSAAAPQAPHAIDPLSGTDHATDNGDALTLRHGWQLAYAEDIHAPGAEISTPSFSAGKWLAATVPGTVLTTLIDRGIYPDPDFGLNNMAIPESLSTKSFWYRDTFTPPSSMRGQHLQLTFNGINYRATVWVNGHPVGEILGAFRHKSFDVTPFVHPGEKTSIAVLIDPPFHPGIPHEQSIAAGSGPNGGMMMLDGPTFGATEGWDWIPGIRDRNIGLWQDVTLTASGAVHIAVPQIITKLPLPDHSKADITVRVPLENLSPADVSGTLKIAFDDITVSKTVTVPSGGTTVSLTSADFHQLTLDHPKLWWPNGYGAQDLHTMTLTFTAGGKLSDTRHERFGIREITCEVSAFDSTGAVRRVEVDPTAAGLLGTTPVVNQTHEGFRETPDGWVSTLTPALEHSTAIHDLTDTRTAPFLVIRVNGVRIAIKGGAWGMDDMRKRVSRERLEPYFRLHKEAHLTMIRNWMGQDTEDTFYDLADEYGLLVWNDFWDSTQDYNLEPTDSSLFLDNARDVITRYRNHPSIAIWCGRNEGVPPPTINAGLAQLVATDDGTRYYSADSNKINLHDSGPYKFEEADKYFTTLSAGFAVEVGVPSPPTLESFQSFLPKEDQWPISDTWAYHDWHQDGNGDVAPFMQTIHDEFGAATSLADFDRKAQMLNYTEHRAIFEGFNAHLWAPNSGRLLWMTQPAWPSSVWQIISHDYDTQASFYGVKKASEPIHIQMNLPTHDIIVVNNTEDALTGLTATARVFTIDGKPLMEKQAAVSPAANAETPALPLDIDAAMQSEGVVLVRLELKDSAGKLLSDNLYWQAASRPGYARMNTMTSATLTVVAHAAPDTNGDHHATVTLTNPGAEPALAAKLTLLTPTGQRILPAYYSDNYVSLLPGESRQIDIAYPTNGPASISLRGWNITPTTTAVAP
jgi:hypothetical protein